MRAIKIDVIKKEVYEVDIVGDRLSMCKELDADGYDSVRIAKAEMLWVDGEGLLRKPPLGAFMFHPYPQALPGHGLIIGLRGPENADTKLTLEEVRESVEFVGISELPVPVIQFASFDTMKEMEEFIKNNR